MKKKVIFLNLIFSVFLYLQIDAQVDLQSGAAEYSIPLYSYSDPNNRISTGVSLVYTAGNGLKVSEIPSNVGAGWTLACGGFIQRIQNGEPDDQKNSDTYIYPNEITNQQQGLDFKHWVQNYFPNGYLYSEYGTSPAMTNDAKYTPLLNSSSILYKPHQKYQADREQDVFMFSMNGQVGYFVIGKKDQNNVYPIRTLYDSKLKIEKIDGDLNNANNIRTTISEFRITDENGIKYVFRDADLDQVCSYDDTKWYNPYGVYQGDCGTSTLCGATTDLKVVRGQARNSYIKNKWYLSEIINPLTTVKILFEYEDYSIDLQSDKIGQLAVSTASGSNPEMSLTIERIKSISKRIKKITLSTSETVEFNYSVSSRIDISSGNALTDIDIKYKGTSKQKWKFEYGYFLKNEIKSPTYNFSINDKVWTRLCLLKIQKALGTMLEPPYSFSYYFGNEDGVNSAVPPLFSYQHDTWGYYNTRSFGGYYNPSTHSYNYTNPPYEPSGSDLLSKEVYLYPLDGLWHFIKSPTIEARNGVLKEVINPLGGALKFEYENQFFDSYNFYGTGGVRVKKTIEYDGIDHLKDIINEYKYVNENNSSSGWGGEIVYAHSEVTSVRLYQKCGDKKYLGISVPSLAKSVFSDPVSRLISGKKLKWESFLHSASVNLRQNIKEYIENLIVKTVIDYFTPDYLDYNVTTYHSEIKTGHNTIPFQYKRVEVIRKILSDNVGKTVYEFTSPSEPETAYAIDVPTLASPYSARPRFGYWLYGLIRRVTLFDKNNNITKKTESHYLPYKYLLSGDPKFESQKWVANVNLYSCPYLTFTTLPSSTEINYDIYYPMCGRIDLDYTREYVYNTTSPQENTYSETNYEYSSNNYLPKKVKTYNSKGELIESYTYYPQDYTLGGALQTMISNNIINTTVSTQKFITKTGNLKYLVAGSYSEFGIISNGDVKTLKTYSFRNDNPVISTVVPFSPSQLNPNSTYYKEDGAISYSNTGNAIQISTDKGKIAKIYEYDNKLAVASVDNATANEIAYSSFEADGWGGWQMVPGSTVISQGGVTGKNSFSGSLQKTSLPSGNYTVTVWSLAWGNVTVNGQAGTALITNGIWKLYEWKLSNVTSITVSGDNIDEARLYPFKARMSTATYDPLIGKTSECGVDNRIIYYEYDDLGRLKIVRDENRNVIKTYEYNYKQ